MQKELPCTSCQFGTLELLTNREITTISKLEKIERRLLPKQIYGCDECLFWCSAEEVEND